MRPPRAGELLYRLRLLVAEAEGRQYPHGRRAEPDAPRFLRPDDIDSFFRPLLAQQPQEQVWVASLTTRHQVISSRMIYQGTLSSSSVRLAEILRPAVIEHAAHIALAHNHPSGDPSPSQHDLHLTERLQEAGRLLDIRLLDHVIIGHESYVSLAERGHIQWHIDSRLGV